MRRSLILLTTAAVGWSCAGGPRQVPIQLGDVAIEGIAGLDGCDDFGDQRLTIDPSRPVTLLVHGCKASSARYQTLAQVYRAQGEQALCFTYDYRDSLEQSSRELLEATSHLRQRLGDQQVTIIGHSQGGLVSRRALIEERDDGARLRGSGPIRLATVSAPFNGIRSSAPCGQLAMHIITLGITAAVCQGIAWREIHPRSDFIRHPGVLGNSTIEHLQIVTDERDSCRRRADDGECLEDDFVFAVAEQRHDLVERDRRVIRTQVTEGHARVVGMEGVPPRRLVEALQEHGYMRRPEPAEAEAFDRLLARLY